MPYVHFLPPTQIAVARPLSGARSEARHHQRGRPLYESVISHSTSTTDDGNVEGSLGPKRLRWVVSRPTTTIASGDHDDDELPPADFFDFPVRIPSSDGQVGLIDYSTVIDDDAQLGSEKLTDGRDKDAATRPIQVRPEELMDSPVVEATASSAFLGSYGDEKRTERSIASSKVRRRLRGIASDRSR